MQTQIFIHCKKRRPIFKNEHVNVWEIDHEHGTVTYSGHKDGMRMQAKLYLAPQSEIPYFNAFRQRMYLHDFEK